MMRYALVCAGFALTACSPPVPDSGAGVGFDNRHNRGSFERYEDHSNYRARRDAELAGNRPPATVPSPNPIPSASAPPAGETAGPPVPNTPPADGDSAAPGPEINLNNPSISDEQDFDAVSNRHSIESDAERLKAQRDAYEVIEPTAVPRRNGTGGPNIVEYALATSNAVGEKVWTRSILSTRNKYERNCAKYASADIAQEEFLRAGGPKRDKLGLDPDGDGFACGWNPAAYRRIAGGRG